MLWRSCFVALPLAIAVSGCGLYFHTPLDTAIGEAIGGKPKPRFASPPPRKEPWPSYEAFDWIGKVDEADDLPKGAMYLATHTVSDFPGGRLAPKLLLATVLVEYDVVTRYGELSHIGLTSTDCASETIWIHSWETFAERGGNGSTVRSLRLPPMTVSKPPGTLGAAVRAICGQRSPRPLPVIKN